MNPHKMNQITILWLALCFSTFFGPSCVHCGACPGFGANRIWAETTGDGRVAVHGWVYGTTFAAKVLKLNSSAATESEHLCFASIGELQALELLAAPRAMRTGCDRKTSNTYPQKLSSS